MLSPLLALAVGASPAAATVTFIDAIVTSQARSGIGELDTVFTGTPGVSSDFTKAPYVTSGASSSADRFLAQVDASSAGAIDFASLTQASFFVRTLVSVDALANQPFAHGAATATALYDFTVSGDSLVTFMIGASADPTASVSLDLYSLDAGTYLRHDQVNGVDTRSNFLTAGSYGVRLIAAAETLVLTTPYSVVAGSGGVANLSLSITALTTPPAVPEPATWAMMAAGFAAAGTRMRRRAAFPLGAA